MVSAPTSTTCYGFQCHCVITFVNQKFSLQHFLDFSLVNRVIDQNHLLRFQLLLSSTCTPPTSVVTEVETYFTSIKQNGRRQIYHCVCRDSICLDTNRKWMRPHWTEPGKRDSITVIDINHFNFHKFIA